MNKLLLACSITAFGILTGATAHAESARTVAERALATWQSQFNARAYDALTASYCEDAVMLPPTDVSVTGTAAIRALLEQDGKRILRHNGADLLDARISGDTLYASGVWSAVARDGERTELIGGNLVNVLERQADGTWKTRIQIWN